MTFLLMNESIASYLVTNKIHVCHNSIHISQLPISLDIVSIYVLNICFI